MLLPIHLLRLPGIENAEETVAVSYRDTAVNSSAVVRSEIAFPLRGRWVGFSRAG